MESSRVVYDGPEQAPNERGRGRQRLTPTSTRANSVARSATASSRPAVVAGIQLTRQDSRRQGKDPASESMRPGGARRTTPSQPRSDRSRALRARSGRQQQMMVHDPLPMLPRFRQRRGSATSQRAHSHHGAGDLDVPDECSRRFAAGVEHGGSLLAARAGSCRSPTAIRVAAHSTRREIPRCCHDLSSVTAHRRGSFGPVSARVQRPT